MRPKIVADEDIRSFVFSLSKKKKKTKKRYREDYRNDPATAFYGFLGSIFSGTKKKKNNKKRRKKKKIKEKDA